MRVKSGLAEMLKGGVIMDVVNAEQAVIAENAGACAVMALERVPADIRRDGGVARMSDPGMIREIQEAVSIPVMAKCRIGHFAEAQILQALEVDYIDESEVLTPADVEHHVDKWGFKMPFVCGADEPRRSAAPHQRGRRDDPHQGRGRHRRRRQRRHAHAGRLRRHQAAAVAAQRRAVHRGQEPAGALELVRWVAENGRLPVVTFTAGGIATPADASLCMQLGAEASSSARASSSPAIPTCARRRSSRRPRTSRTRRSWPRSRRVSESRWSASPPHRSPTASGSKFAAGRRRATGRRQRCFGRRPGLGSRHSLRLHHENRRPRPAGGIP